MTHGYDALVWGSKHQSFTRIHAQGVQLLQVTKPRWNFTFERVSMKIPERQNNVCVFAFSGYNILSTCNTARFNILNCMLWVWVRVIITD